MRQYRWLRRAWVLAFIAIFTFPLTGSYANNPATVPSAFADGILLDYVPDEIVFCIKAPATVSELCNEYKIELDRGREHPVGIQNLEAKISLLHFAKVSEDRLGELIESLNHDPRIEYAERRYYFTLEKETTQTQTVTPADASTQNLIRDQGQWGLTVMEVEGVPQSETLIAVIDTGMEITNPEMAAAIVPGGYDWFHKTSTLTDPDGHGTHIANLIAGPYGVGQFKVLPEAIWIGTDQQGRATLGVAEAAMAVRHAVDKGAKVINMSFGGPGATPQSLLESIRYAGEHYVLCTIAAGNDGSNNVASPFMPASCGEWNVIPVAATQNPKDSPDEELFSFSNYGGNVLVGAPGTALSERSTSLSWETLFGTSVAAPFVAAEAALAFDLYQEAQAVKEAILCSVDIRELLRDKIASAGRINFRRMRAGERNPGPELSIASQFQGIKKVPITISVTVVNPSGGALQFHWDFGDGKTEDTDKLEVLHKYKKKKTYQLVCTATYFTGRTFTVTAPVSIAKK